MIKKSILQLDASLGETSGLSAAEWERRQAEYHRRKLALWEQGFSGERFTWECRAVRDELELMEGSEYERD